MEIGNLSEAARLEMIGEEAAELSQAALKLARYYRGENPVCRTKEELEAHLIEEISDVLLAVSQTKYRPDWTVVRVKKERWIDRLNYLKDIKTP